MTKKQVTSEWLINITNTNKYDFKKDVTSLNNFFVEQNLNLNLKFEHKQGFRLVGYEQHLRFITAIIVIKLVGKHNNLSLTNDKALTYIYNKIKIIMINSGYKKHYNEQVLWFLAIHVQRIKFNFFLDKNSQIELNLNSNIKKEGFSPFMYN